MMVAELRAMSLLGSLHVAAAVGALTVAAIVLVRRTKGTTAHVRHGRLYAVLMVLVDAFALLTLPERCRPFPPSRGHQPGDAHRRPCVVAAQTRFPAKPRDPDDLVGRRTRRGWVGPGSDRRTTTGGPLADRGHTAGVCLLATLATRALASSKPAVGSS